MKYIVLDLDGTMLMSDHKVSTELKQLLIQLQNEGIKLVLCTGRNINTMRHIAKEVELYKHDTYVITNNGGTITQIKDGKEIKLKETFFTKQQVSDLVNIVDGKTRDIISFDVHNRYVNRYSLHNVKMMLRHRQFAKLGVKRIANKVLFVDEIEVINKHYQTVVDAVQKYDPEINIFRSVPTLIEMTPHGSTKGGALQTIIEKHKIDINEVIAFGDGENDITMLKYVPNSVAMGNAFVSVKAVASDICDTNDNNGVYKYLTVVFNK